MGLFFAVFATYFDKSSNDEMSVRETFKFHLNRLIQIMGDVYDLADYLKVMLLIFRYFNWWITRVITQQQPGVWQ